MGSPADGHRPLPAPARAPAALGAPRPSLPAHFDARPHLEMTGEVFKRVRNQPILTPEHMPFGASAVFNPGVVSFGNEVLLLLRIEDRRGISQIRVARSRNGIDHWRIDERPLLEPGLPGYPLEEWGCEDARVTRIGDELWIIAYTAYSRYGPTVALATTSDFVEVNRLGAVLSPLNKDAAVFPERIGDRWIMLHRPVAGGQEHIWYVWAHSDLVHWSLPGVVIPERGGPWWDGLKIGVGAPPIRTEDGWLLIYHGAKEVAQTLVYRLGLALLDLEDPVKLIRRASDWVFAPELEFERHGLAPNVVYTCGVLEQGDDIWMYYGAGDTAVGLAIAKRADLLRFVHEHDFLHRLGRAAGGA
jgi:beta-1,4-mannooligosaccharide/beta-1,4-mannosyl-N-acetylglucosamine phosphorylase